MEPVFSLAHLTVLDLPPPAVIRVAAAAGCRAAGLRLLPVAPGAAGYPLQDDPALLRETLAAMADTGVAVADLEIVMLRPDTRVAEFLPMLEAGARLGAKHVLVAGYDPEEARLTASFAAFCEAAAGFGLTGDLEFMPWTAVPDLPAAIRVVRGAAQPNGGVLVDALHVDRSRSRVADLAAVPPGWLHYWQLCDAPAERPTTTEGLLHTARAERLFPGEGGLDLLPLARAMPPAIPVSLEIPTLELAKTLGPEARARRAVDGARRVLAAARG
ncbi:sugar phosphate isomerase/epimerase family protein [Paracraurococcus ruber]|uniref:Xylose isomerase n=1 Tax=Paracraurococcus ruber TaxID=77675 RepID=A0ABS1CTG6_9PROT|nr:TIM barrel protein [Paracraurococcus ruber]MBK1657685.1 xylose isomerase [Paracraurococcus ruber]TDG31511.1 sugar phosphate isomerase/epimerase [Paracraurococcus ruber]